MSASTGTGPRNKHSKLDNEHLDISKGEFERIREALKKEEFRKLFFEYVEEIQDPANRKIYEDEITQLEKERGVEVKFIHPKPGFVVKTSIDGQLKCFINIASCAEVARPNHEIAQNPETGARGMNWSIPMAQTASRDDVDANKKHCKVFDVVFHPDAVYLSERNPHFRKCLIDTALDAVEREYHVKLDRANLKFPKLDYKGIPRPTVIRKLADHATAEEREPHPLEHLYPQKPTADSDKPKVLPMKMNLTPKPQFTVPKYAIKHSHDVDLTEYTDELDAKLHLTVPRALIVEIELPLLKSTADCQLDVTEKSIYLLSEQNGAKYKLKLDLPYAVDDKAGSARFDTDRRQLCITLPVLRSNAQQQRSMHDTLRHFNREDSGVELHSNSESPVEEDADADGDGEVDLSDSTEEHITPAVSDVSTTVATPVLTPQTFLKSSLHYQLPAKFDCNVLDNVMAFVLHVPNVQPDSVLTLQQPRSLHLQFATLGSGYYPTHYAFYIQLPDDAAEGLCIDSSEAETWDNNVVLKLNLNAASKTLQTYQAGLDSSHLMEYDVHNKYRLHGKQMGLQSAAPLKFSVAPNDDDHVLEVSIRPQQSNDSNCCAANTTEDEEAGGSVERQQQQQRQSQKKQNKRQRKRNKKVRSLSESACDDIKVFHAKQQNSQSTAAQADSSPECNEGSSKPMHTLKFPQRKQRSYSECNDSSVGSAAGNYRGILKRFSRYGPRPSISDSCSSIDECSSSYSCSVDAAGGVGGYAHSFGGIPEELDDAGLSESCKKTVRFNDHIMKQVFRHDSSILGQRKKNQKRRDCKLRAQQRRVSEGDSADYEDTNTALKTAGNAQYFKQPNCKNNSEDNTMHKLLHHDSGLDLAGNSKSNNEEETKRTKKHGAHHDSDAEAKNSMIFEMDDDM